MIDEEAVASKIKEYLTRQNIRYVRDDNDFTIFGKGSEFDVHIPRVCGISRGDLFEERWRNEQVKRILSKKYAKAWAKAIAKTAEYQENGATERTQVLERKFSAYFTKGIAKTMHRLGVESDADIEKWADVVSIKFEVKINSSKLKDEIERLQLKDLEPETDR